MQLYLFNPENDLALADGNANYSAPPSANKIAYDLSTLPLWFADEEDFVLLPDAIHTDYYNTYSQIFKFPQLFTSNNNSITHCTPWGWSLQIRKRFTNMGFSDEVLPSIETINKLRELSNRKVTIEILKKLSNKGIDVPPLPQYITTTEEVGEFICSMPLSVIKAPWSGSGKGIAWGLGRREIPIEHFAKGVIRRQGGVICEKFLNKAVDFAMEFYFKKGKISFKGYSLFKSTKGVYSGNILADDFEIEKFLNSYNPQTSLSQVKSSLISVLEDIFNGFEYEGYFGVDMMIYSDEENKYHINPCVELNLRMNMGAASRILYDKHIESGKTGEYNVVYFKHKGEALSLDLEYKTKYPPIFKNGKISSGYLNLSPITEDSDYAVYVIIENNIYQSSLSSLYNR